MSRDDLFHDPLDTEDRDRDLTNAPDTRQTVDQVFQRSLELLRVQDELRSMARAEKRS